MPPGASSLTPPVHVGYLVSHPIQYQAPLLRRIAEQPGIELTVFFCSDFSVRGYVDPGFRRSVTWDVPLLGGYKHEFLPSIDRGSTATFFRPLNYGLTKRLKALKIDVLWVHGYARFYNLVAIAAAKRAGIKVMLRDEATRVSRTRGLVKRAVKRAFFAGLNSLCDAYLPIGTLNREYFTLYGVPDESMFLMPYAVDNAHFVNACASASTTREELRKELGLDPARPVILFASKLIERKRCRDLLDAYERLSRDGRTEPIPYLIIIGDGELRGELVAQANALNWRSIRFLGFKNQTELPRYYDLCDVFVLPSVDEPWGLVVNEAMNAGRAIIASDKVGSSRDLVKHGVNGYVSRAGDVSDLLRGLQEVLKDRATTNRMGKESSRIIANWSFAQDVAGLRQALKHVVPAGHSG